MAWLMLCVALWDKPVITVSLYAPLVCQFCSIRKEKTIEFHVCVWKALSMSLFNIPVSLLGGRLCFSCMDSLCLSFLKKKILAEFQWKQQFSRGQNSRHTHFSFFLCLSLSPTLSHRCARAHMSTYIDKCTCSDTQKKKPHSFSLRLCLWEQLNLSLRFYSGLKSREMVCGV